tara:strand:+ start:512 stop:631 length:120 start_codon:yes stop_codon:yes gene_type:complete
MTNQLQDSKNFKELVTLFYRGENELMNEVAQQQQKELNW